MTTCHAQFMRTETVQALEKFCKTQNRDHGKHRTETMGETEGTGASAIVPGVVGKGSRKRLPVPLLTTRAPWNPQLSWPWETSCGGRTLTLSDGRYAAQAVAVDGAKC